MATLGQTAKYIRSKNAGPFWITIDIFCETPDDYGKIAASPAISEETISGIYHVDPAHVRIYRLPSLNVIKISFPREIPQGSPEERDMHGGQQYIPLLKVEI